MFLVTGKKKLSASLLNSYNFMILRCILFCFSPGQTFVFQTKIYIYIYIYLINSYVIHVAFSSSLRPEDQFGFVYASSIFLNTRNTRT